MNSNERPAPAPARPRNLPDPTTPVVTAPSVPLERAGWQWLPVSAHIRERYLVTFRAPADAVARLVPANCDV